MTDREINVVEWAMKDAQRTEACKFAEWLATNDWKPRINTEWCRYEFGDIVVRTTEQLYELFKKESP